ncbi:transcriptional regulator [Bacillus subtilis]|uniref:LexA family transcriptional repressor n=1 Tax=Bacillus subtilis TaxID=1423 RepID=A0A0D1IM81_BACIU|nr:transcriptional regulator [Bacillus subtilis]AWX20956.1 transcriptional regulator [Bacillus subtilis subsp. subtilis]KIU10248.1 LexA family transcriptional repressor [Bacillus subtilis]KMN93422.1 transcriptional regulator [Bacillus subtilis]MDP8527930.1 transcriptional regulator [Bacillus subtilis]MEC0314762.1 transcriptional regulator [Bacillus subtilis]
MRKITERQFETLQVIEKYINEKGFAPTYRELMDLLGLTSTSTVKGLLDALRRKEYITWEQGLPRTLKIMHR